MPYLSLGVQVLDAQPFPRMRIPPPADLRLPYGHTTFDAEYADATWESVRRGDDAARRLGRAIDWLSLAWLNVTELTDDLRVPAIRAAFEVLLDADDSEDSQMSRVG